MDASDLRVFEAVARLGGMSRAAEALHTVQSNVTARIRALEASLGVVLFERHSRGTDLTDAGRRLLPYAQRVAALLAEAAQAARDDGRPAGSLTIGSLETTVALRLSHRLAAFARAHPAVDLVLRTGTTCELLDEVLAGRLDGAFVCGPVEHPELTAETMFQEELAVIGPPGLGDLGDIGDARIVVLRSGCSYRQRLEEVLARRGIPAPRRLEFGTIEALIGCAAAGLGITLLPITLVG
ncbi:MAG TPA: LysR family transcriptional regulator, partial [Acidisphaera sp.]|nr:LysR family transcriptional regulator [Acidisphaera sp.]